MTIASRWAPLGRASLVRAAVQRLCLFGFCRVRLRPSLTMPPNLLPSHMQCYLPDLLTMERLKLVAPGSLLVADNVIVPGAPDFLEYVSEGPGVPGSLGYETELVEGVFEVEQKYKDGWEPKRDAMAVSRCVRAV